jgi:hypothetical protein
LGALVGDALGGSATPAPSRWVPVGAMTTDHGSFGLETRALEQNLATEREILHPGSVRSVGESANYGAAVILGDGLLPLIVLALGAAMAVGSALALVRPPDAPKEGELERAPVGRSIAMIVIGTLAAIWALASLVAK